MGLVQLLFTNYLVEKTIGNQKRNKMLNEPKINKPVVEKHHPDVSIPEHHGKHHKLETEEIEVKEHHKIGHGY